MTTPDFAHLEGLTEPEVEAALNGVAGQPTTPDRNPPQAEKDDTHGGVEQRVWMHWRSMKGYFEFKVDRVEDGLTPGGLVYGHYEPTTPNHVWLHLARVHKMKVRRVKDIVNARRAKRVEVVSPPGQGIGGRG